MSINLRRLKPMWFSFLKKTVVQLKKISDLWNSESGDWHWLVEKPRPLASLNRDLWKASVPAFSFYFLLALSSIISTLGLLAGSAATIIGAMIIAPLMGPIIGMAYAMVVANRRLLRRSSLTLFTGVVMTVIVSMAIANTIGLRTLSEEILARVNPTLIDLGVAMCAGAAGAFAKCRRSIGDALPGVAIAVALVPPLSVIGIGLSIGSKSVTGGASLLFLTNLISIIFSGGLVFLFHRYGSLERAKKGLFVSVIGLTLLGLPLGFSLKTLLIKENVRRSISVLIRRQTLTFSDKDIRTIQVVPQGDELFVEVEVAAAFNSISERQVSLVRDFLEDELERPVNLQVKVIPVNYFEAPAD
ncbi:TIGR00341 family protein [Oscillatoria salina]|uniref:TIGR00341 family protein n=1 Tax=Oscillatoria salina TaxID=331517 RepID=UPI001CCC1984|nr:TIGR00341 family protein [Oscillatoria salina]